MTDITKRLRYKAGMSYRRRDAGLYEDAADEIERLRAALWDYGEHILTCRVRDGGECDCGFMDLMKTLNGPTGSD